MAVMSRVHQIGDSLQPRMCDATSKVRQPGSGVAVRRERLRELGAHACADRDLYDALEFERPATHRICDVVVHVRGAG